MRPVPVLLSLSASSFLLVISFPQKELAQRGLRWPFSLPAHERYYPQHTDSIQRDVAIQERLIGQPPAGVRKMSDDEGEKFFMDYWLFDEGIGGADEGGHHNHARKREARGCEQMTEGTNGSSLFRPPLPLHAGEGQEVLSLLLFGRSFAVSRDFLSPFRKRSF